jgi:hypothetical protein
VTDGDTDSSPDRADAPIRVFLLDDHEIVRRGIRELPRVNRTSW